MSKHAEKRLISHADERRQALVQAAYQSIAEQGFQGLRTRDIAAQVGITHATLHYYFPTKEDLIRAVVDYAVFQRLLANVPRYEGNTPLEKLHAFITTLQQHMRQNPDDFLVLYELVRNAPNEPAIREAFTQQEIFGGWHHNLKSLVEAGIAEGQFRSGLHPESAASLLMTLILGLGMTLLIPVPSADEAIVTQLEQMLAK